MEKIFYFDNAATTFPKPNEVYDFMNEYYKNNGVDCEIHYVCVDDDTWKQNIQERNQRVIDGNGGSDFYLDEGLMKKLESKWEEPTEDEYDVIYKVKR